VGYYLTPEGIWRTDGQTSYQLAYLNPTDLLSMNDSLYFVTNDNIHGSELFKYIPPFSQISLVIDINPGIESSYPSHFTLLNCSLYFSADDGTLGAELWKSDGTSAGTQLLKDINAGGGSSNPEGFVESGSTIFFWANDGIHGTELWKTDGTSPGTQMVKDLNPDSIDVEMFNNPIMPVKGANGICYFLTADSSNISPRIYRSDGTEPGTYTVTSASFKSENLWTGVSVDIGSVAMVNGTIFLYGTELNDSIGSELYKISCPEAQNSCDAKGCFICGGQSLKVDFNFLSTANTGNIYTAQLSDTSGSFANPVSIGTLTSTKSGGTISCPIPGNTPYGSAYSIRVKRSSPAELSQPLSHNLTISSGIWYQDLDDDGFGNSEVIIQTCFYQPPGYVNDSSDCNDNNSNIHPGVPEIPNNGVDDDCNGDIDSIALGFSDDKTSSLFSVSPNPASNFFILQLQLESKATFPATIVITTPLGEKVFEKESQCNRGFLREEIFLDQNFPRGMYFVKLSSEGQQWVKCVVVEK